MAVWRIASSNFSLKRSRVALTVSAIALSLSLVVAVTSGYASAQAAVWKYAGQYLGSTDVKVSPEMAGQWLTVSLLDALRTDPDVINAVGRLESRAPLLNSDGETLPGRAPPTLIGVQVPQDREIKSLEMESGFDSRWFKSADAREAVIDQELARSQELAPGDLLRLPSPADEPFELTIVGVIHKPQIMAALQSTLYLPLQTLQAYLARPNQVTDIFVDLRPAADEQAFVARWRQRLATDANPVRFVTARQTRGELEKHLQGVQLLSYLGGAVSMLAASFIVFSTLAMGVGERQRTLAMLRAIGATRMQVARVVFIEGMLLAAAGVVIGLPLGLVWLKILTVWKAEFFQAGAVISFGGLAFGSAGAVVTALLASILPAWLATRVAPIEALTATGQQRTSAVPVWAALAGLALIGIDPLLMFAPGLHQGVRFYGHFALGLPALMIGFFLLAPAFVWLVEKTLGRIVSLALGVKYALLAQQLTRSIWRSAGTASALMVGLAILIVLQTQGNSTLSGWKLPTRFPDFFIYSAFSLGPEQVKTLESIQGVRRDQVLPIAHAFAPLKRNFWSRVLPAALMPDATMFIGLEPDKALRMMELDFRQGSAADAVAKLKQGRHLIITEEFHRLKGIGVGETITLNTPENGPVDYTVAGVVWSPGIDVFVSLFDMGRQFEERSAATVFGSLDDARRDFGVRAYNLFAANLEYFVDREQLTSRIRSQLGNFGLVFGDVRHIKAEVEGNFRKLLLLVSTIALSAIFVASLGLTNTILASIRSRRWQLGILRSLGVTRGMLLRTIIAEAILLGIVGCILGTAAGLLMGVNANAFSGHVIGYQPPIAVPWNMVLLGIAIVMTVAVLASLYPAIRAARQEPLALLQSGRAAA